MKRKGRSGPPRLLVVDKPAGPTSFDVVRRVRYFSGYRRVGHAGTLDPFASGVLVLGLGSATRLLRFASDGEKSYRMTVRFGQGTDSHDCTGESTKSSPISFDRLALERALEGFRGEIRQRPPRLSAIHVDGERAYRLFRGGAQELELDERVVHLHRVDLLRFEAPDAELRVDCSSGTYMRALARDLGEALGCPAHAAILVRERVGGFELGDAQAFDALGEDDWYDRSRSPAELFADARQVILDPDAVARVRQGEQPREAWTRDADPGAPLVLLDTDGELVAVAEEQEGRWRLSVVLPEA